MSKIDEDIWETEIVVEDVNFNTILRDIFRPDYLKTRELSSRKIRLSHWHEYVIYKLVRELKTHGFTQVGKVFARRRLIKYGLSLFEKDNKTIIDDGQKRRDALMVKYDPGAFAMLSNVTSLYTHDISDKRTTIYLEDSDYERISDNVELCRLSFDSIVQLCISYAVVELQHAHAYFDDITESEKEIERLKDFFHK